MQQLLIELVAVHKPRNVRDESTYVNENNSSPKHSNPNGNIQVRPPILDD
jgi:hypothetical protein